MAEQNPGTNTTGKAVSLGDSGKPAELNHPHNGTFQGLGIDHMLPKGSKQGTVRSAGGGGVDSDSDNDCK